MNIWSDLMSLYPEIAFDYVGGRHSQAKKPKCKYLCVIEPHTICPSNWNIKIIDQYDIFITWNKKFCQENNFKASSIILEGGCLTDNITTKLTSFTSYDEKIKGVIILGKLGHNMYSGNIYHLRKELAENLEVAENFLVHIYAHNNWGGVHYQGHLPGSPWDVDCLEKVSQYLFNFCPENTYHSLWSYGYLCEKLFRSFKSKTVGLYLGCYNIEDYIPSDLFIDLREFYVNGKMNWRDLSDYLINFPKEKYIEMTEKAYEWEQRRTVGCIDNFENTLEKVISL